MKTLSNSASAIAARNRRAAQKAAQGTPENEISNPLTQAQASVAEAMVMGPYPKGDLVVVAPVRRAPAKIYQMPEPEVVEAETVAEVSAEPKRRGPAPRFEKPTLEQWHQAREAAALAALEVQLIGQRFHQESAVAAEKVRKAEAALAEVRLRKVLP